MKTPICTRSASSSSSPPSNSTAFVRYADIHPIAEAMMNEAERTHVVRRLIPQREGAA